MFRNHSSTSNQTSFNNNTAPIKRTNNIYITMERASFVRRDTGILNNDMVWAGVAVCVLMILAGIFMCVYHYKQEKDAARQDRAMRRIQAGSSVDEDGFELQPVTGGRQIPRRPPPTYSRY